MEAATAVAPAGHSGNGNATAVQIMTGGNHAGCARPGSEVTYLKKYGHAGAGHGTIIRIITPNRPMRGKHISFLRWLGPSHASSACLPMGSGV